MHIERLKRGQGKQARALFSLLSKVLEKLEVVPGEAYIDHLLQQPGFWAVAAVVQDDVIGGLTAHVIPMTKDDTSELLIYDVAVREDRQRQGIGQLMLDWVLQEAFASGIDSVFVLADSNDQDAIRFYRKLDGRSSAAVLLSWVNEPSESSPA